MNMSKRLTLFSIFSLFLVVAFAAVPAMAQTIEAEWADELEGTNVPGAGWKVTIGGLKATDVVTVTYLDVNGTTAAAAGTQDGFGAVEAEATSTTGNIPAAIGAEIAVQVSIQPLGTGDSVLRQRVTFPAAGPGATLASTDLDWLPKLAKLTTSEYYASFGETVTITFNFAAADNDDKIGAPAAPLHISDVTLGDTTNWQIVSVSGTNMVTIRSTYAAGATSASTTVDLGTNYTQPTATATDGQATVLYDDTAPTITNGTITVAAPPGSPTPPDNVWGGDFPVFNLTFSVSDETNGSGLPDVNPIRIVTDTDKLEVVAIGLATEDNGVEGTEYLVQIRPKTDRVTTAGEPVIITVMPVDKAGNEGSGAVSVKLAASNPVPTAVGTIAARTVRVGATAVTVDVASNFRDTDTLTYTAVSSDTDKATVSVSGSVVTITPVAAGTATITVTASDTATPAQTATQTIAVTVNAAPVPNAVPTAVDTIDAQTVKVGAAPVTVDVASKFSDTDALTYSAVSSDTDKATVSVSGSVVTITAVAEGSATITVTATDTASQTATQTIAVTVNDADFVSANPSTDDVPGIMLVNIPANSFVVLVRSNPDPLPVTLAALNFPSVPPVGGDPVDVRVWSDMPDLHDLFRRSAQSPGGALVLRQSADDAAADRPAVGTVGISEIMWARDLGKKTAEDQAAEQWIELQNLNDKPVKVLIYAQKGSDGLVSGGLLVNTAAGDNLLGRTLGGMVIDAIQNIRNDGVQGNGGWDVKGKEGNSLSGQPFASMHRILPFNKSKYENANGSRFSDTKGTWNGHWAESGSAYVRGQTETTPPVLFDYRGTPGAVNNVPGISLLTPAARQNVPANSVIINEVANLTEAKYNWIELRNLTGSEINLRNYLISIVTGVGSDEPLYQFPNNNNAVIPANGVFLLVATDPRDEHAQPSEHPLAIGWNVDKNAEDQVRGTKKEKSPHYKVAGSLAMPSNGHFVMILRKAKGFGVARTGEADLNLIVDIAGYHPNLHKSNYPNQLTTSRMWPLQGHGRGPQFNRNQFSVNTVHYRANVGTADGLAGAGAVQNANDHRAAFQDAGFTGIGYKRQAARTAANGGTPGYHGIERGTVASGAKLIISEIMLSQGGGRTNLPQWIEIYNPNDTVVQLDAGAGWRIVIEEERINLRTLNFKSKGSVKRVLPKQTILVVSAAARDLGSDYLPSSVVFPSTRVFNVYRELASTFGMTSRFDPFLSENSFNLKLIDGSGAVSDEMGNLDGNVRTSDTAKYEFSQDTMTKEGLRTSYIRILDEGVARNALSIEESNVLPLGAKEVDDTVNLARHQIPMKYAWIRASQADLGVINIRHTWYGSEEDFGTPLLREGAVLPVQLSSFRPELEDGKVVIRWATESELDNAGFNIYRSDDVYGEFKQVNAEMIEGHGTTGERHTYKWVDTSAKLDTVYYYQIEDVSFAGERQTLATTKLKGLISAKNKLTTRWGELKEIH